MTLMDNTEVSAVRTDGPAALRVPLELLIEETGADTATVVRFDDERDEIVVEAAAGDTVLRVGSRLPIGTSTNFLTARSGRTFGSGDLTGLAEYERPLDRIALANGLASGCTIPLSLGASSVGAVTVGARRGDWPWRAAAAVMTGMAQRLVITMMREFDDRVSSRVLVCHDDLLTAEGLATIAQSVLGVQVTILRRSIHETAEHIGRESDLIITGDHVRALRIDEQVKVLRSMGVVARVLVIASHDTRGNRLAAKDAGVAGYCPRTAPRAGIADALLKVGSGERVLPAVDHDGSTAAPTLTPRERQVLLALERGKATKEIALALSISQPTVKWHMRRIFEKLGVHSGIAAVHAAHASGLLESLTAGQLATRESA